MVYPVSFNCSGLNSCEARVSVVAQRHKTALFSKGMRIAQPEAAQETLMSPFGQGDKSGIVTADG